MPDQLALQQALKGSPIPHPLSPHPNKFNPSTSLSLQFPIFPIFRPSIWPVRACGRIKVTKIQKPAHSTLATKNINHQATSRQEIVRHMDSREGLGVATSPTYSHSSSISPPRVTYHMWRRPSAVISSMRVVVLLAILGNCRGNGRLGLGLGFDCLRCFWALGLWMSVRIVMLHRGKAFFCTIWSSLFRVEDDCCSVEEKGLTSLLGF